MTFYKETNFKEEAFVGEIPKDWQAVRLGDLGAFQYGITASAKNEETGIRFLRITDIKNGETIEWSTVPYCELSDAEIERYQLQIGNVLFARIGATTGKTCYVGRSIKSVFGSYLIRFQQAREKEIDTMFLYYYTQSKIYWSQVNRVKEGQLKKGLNTELLKDLMLPYPSYSEQRNIVQVLSVVDSAIELANKVIAKTERLKKGLMQQLLTRGIGHTEYKDTPIGKTPKTWQIVRLEDVSEDFIGGGTPSTSNPEYWNGDIAWMTSAHINERLITTGQKYITRKGVENSATKIVPRNNLLVATRVGIGKAAINKIDIAISQDLTGMIINKEKALPEFLYWVLINSGKKLKALAQGSTIKGILREELGRLHIPLPPIAEQERIGGILSTVDKKLELERNGKTRLERVKRGLMDLLLTGRIRVKVD